MKNYRAFAGLLVALTLFVSSAQAERIYFEEYVNTCHKDFDLDVSVDVTVRHGYAKFTFDNDTSYTSVTSIYFEKGLSHLFSNSHKGGYGHGDVDFSWWDAHPKNPVWSQEIHWHGNHVSAGAEGWSASSMYHNGINGYNNDSLTLYFKLNDSSTTTADIVQALGHKGSRIALTILGKQRYGQKGCYHYEYCKIGAHTPVIPTPAAIGPGLLLLAGIAARRRRNAA